MSTQTNCIFCKIASGEIPSQKVYEDEYIYAFKDLYPAAPSHALVIPKKHISDIMGFGEQDEILMAKVLQGVQKVASILGLDEQGFRVVNNMGEHGGQTVFHVHFHVLGGRHLTWPPG